MQNKTAGAAAYAAYKQVLHHTPKASIFEWEELSSRSRQAFDESALAVREHYRQELKLAGSMIIRGAEDMQKVRDIRKVLAVWRDAHEDTDPGYYDCDAINAICKILGELTIDESEAPAHERHRAPPED